MDSLILPTPTPPQNCAVDLLLRRLDNGDAQTHAPISTDEFPLPVLIHAAVRIIDRYDYTGEGPTHPANPISPSEAKPKTATVADTEIAKKYLRAWVLVSREPVHRLPGDAEKAQRNFIVECILKQRHQLWYQHLTLYTIIKDTRSITKTPSPQITPRADLKKRRVQSVRDNVRKRDQHMCKISGQLARYDIVEERQVRLVDDVTGDLEVAHGIPWNPRPEYNTLLEAVFGIKLPSDPVCAENAMLLMNILHSLFTEFLISFTWSDEKNSLVFEFRPGTLRDKAVNHIRGTIMNVTGQLGPSLEGRTLLPGRIGCGIAEPDRFWFDLRRLLGDVFWMAGGVEPPGFGEDDDEEEESVQVVSDDNIGYLMTKIMMEHDGHTLEAQETEVETTTCSDTTGQ